MDDFGLETAVESSRQSLVVHPHKTAEIKENAEAQLKWFQRAARTLTATELEASHLLFPQQIWLLSTLVLRICLRVNLKVTD